MINNQEKEHMIFVLIYAVRMTEYTLSETWIPQPPKKYKRKLRERKK